MADPHVLSSVVADPGLTNATPEKPHVTAEVERLLENLSDLERDVVLLRAGQGLRHRQVGELVWPHLSEGHSTLRSTRTYQRAVKKIRSGWKPVSHVDPMLSMLAEQAGISPDQIRETLASMDLRR